MNDWADAILAGDRLLLARLISAVENRQSDAIGVLEELFPYTGKSHLIGITGSPGSGKSTLVNRLVQLYRRPPKNMKPKTVAVVAVDPTSPFSGGALLGDRVRMRDLSGDAGIFIRSMATRGSLGGLAASTSQVVQVLEAAGFEIIMIETVGVGQSEIDIAGLAHTVLVIEAPGMGDEIQAGKAGILEIADILVVNKADQPGADKTKKSLNQMLDMGYVQNMDNGDFNHHLDLDESQTILKTATGWRPPVIKSVAIRNEGIDALFEAIDAHLTYLTVSGEWGKREQKRLKTEMDHFLSESIINRWRSQISEEKYLAVLKELMERTCSPGQAVKKLIALD